MPVGATHDDLPDLEVDLYSGGMAVIAMLCDLSPQEDLLSPRRPGATKSLLAKMEWISEVL